MTGCAAPGCSRSSRNGYRLFRFPTSEKRRMEWTLNTKRLEWIPTVSSRLCEAHFDDSQYENIPLERRKLRGTAVPTLFNLPNPPTNTARAQKRRSPSVPQNLAACYEFSTYSEHNYAKETLQAEFINVKEECNFDNFAGNIADCSKEEDIFADNTEHSTFYSLDNISTCRIKEEPFGSEVQGQNTEQTPECLLQAVDVSFMKQDTGSHVQEKYDYPDGFVDQDSVFSEDDDAGSCADHNKEQSDELSINNRKRADTSTGFRDSIEILQLQQQVLTLQKQLKKAKQETALIRSQVANLTFLSEEHRTLLLSGRKVTEYSPEMINEAVKLKVGVGCKGYKYLIKKGFPLPSYSTVCRKLQNTDLRSSKSNQKLIKISLLLP